MTKVYPCFVCGKIIIEDRAKFLISEGVALDNLTCLNHSQTQKIKGIYSGENGTSDIILCNKVYNDDVRSKFHAIEEETDGSIDE